MVKEFDLGLSDGRKLHVYDTGPVGATDRLVVFWQHGTPNIGTPPEPLFPVSERLGIRWVSYDRPGYGGSTPVPGRDIASAAGHVSAVADALGIGRFAIMGHSGGGPHALACGDLLGERVLAVVSIAGMAPRGADGLDWFAGMCPSGEAALRAAAAGRAARERHEATSEYDPEMFTPADHAALEGEWSWFGSVVGPAVAGGPGGQIDDDLAYVRPWGADPARVSAPVLLVHGDQDRVVPVAHGRRLARHCPSAELRTFPDDGHISILHAAPAALDWVRAHAA
ncbi:alpha/beta fold hydrolase [Nonomuraea phyllanthi]|uniref:Alpha/beta fold hydrolase n=1 Tax=Nonomuraea phyllanthi TaxID=2219224 RepID=A0A5C4W8J0_9ACTN|nr:alpha/beta hydrolase [Nonomuraea phyllanthi]KAB8192243.1 alpha/beta fold hydrolase [Nonomuraea phyllanthi]QFY11404.1 alpha/beta fold hydrolase [Nonomuraea phyllanthi]